MLIPYWKNPNLGERDRIHMLQQRHVDIQRLWKRLPQSPWQPCDESIDRWLLSSSSSLPASLVCVDSYNTARAAEITSDGAWFTLVGSTETTITSYSDPAVGGVGDYFTRLGWFAGNPGDESGTLTIAFPDMGTWLPSTLPLPGDWYIDSEIQPYLQVQLFWYMNGNVGGGLYLPNTGPGAWSHADVILSDLRIQVGSFTGSNIAPTGYTLPLNRASALSPAVSNAWTFQTAFGTPLDGSQNAYDAWGLTDTQLTPENLASGFSIKLKLKMGDAWLTELFGVALLSAQFHICYAYRPGSSSSSSAP